MSKGPGSWRGAASGCAGKGPLQVLLAVIVSSISIALIIVLPFWPSAFNLADAQSSPGELSSSSQAARQSVLPLPELRPKVVVNLHDWVGRLSDDIRAVGNRTSCVQSIRRAYEEAGKPQLLEPAKLRDNVLAQINLLLSQHRGAVSAIVSEAESLAVKHNFMKNLTVNYTDVHRIRNELEPLPPVQTVIDPITGQPIQQQQLLQDSAGPAGFLGSSSGQSGSVPQFTSIGGGTPVPGPPEWQTPIKSIVMRVNKNFGDIPVNTSMSAVHLPVPIYAGQPEIMNGIAWTEKLDIVFKRNLAQFAHVHHQYYGDRLGFLRTFPAHKWRIPRLDPDLFDARTRPWYVAGSSSPKNIVILIDSSGSMTGLRREIAKGVVFEILDSLTSSDYFTVLRFSEAVTPVGLPKCSGLRQPKLTLEMREQCASLLTSHQHHKPPSFSSPSYELPVDTSGSLRDQRLECAVFERQLERSTRYLRDHEDLMLAQNGSYLSDDAYEKSIRNLTNEIRDAYMLPATSRNIRYLKSNFSMPTAGIANFTNALMGAFELLQAYERTSDIGAQCNQAIMLITDGAMKAHEEIFNRYNYPNASVRVFTYMIGREVGDIRPTKAIACNNRGYYTHVINLNEVREQVLKYLSVMARPLVLAHHHPISWTPAYGDETHQVLTDWVLEIKRRERARIMLNEERERLTEANVIIELTNIQEYDDFPLVDELLKIRIICEDNFDESRDMDSSLQAELDPLGYNDLACHWTTRRADLLTSVVKPVFDNRDTSLIFQRVLQKNIWSEQETHVRNAQMLGVAAVDLRISDILKSIPSYLLGPNGYAILIGQNGFIMHHPDLRALLEDPFDRQSKILKPYFNAVDLSHIEQVYIKNESLDSASNINRIKQHSNQRSDLLKLLKLREAAIRGQSGSDQFFVKRAIDCRRRPHIRQQLFYYGPVKDTPFSLILALPVTYGLNRIRASRELERDEINRHFSPSAYDLWTVHPDYKYCEGPGLVNKDNSSVAKILEVLSLANAGLAGSIHYDDLNSISSNGPGGSGKQRIVCDAELFPALLFDASATNSNGPNSFCKTDHDNCFKSSAFFYMKSEENNNEDLCTKNPDEMRSKLANIYGLEMSFLATRSGLTRVRVYDLSLRIKKLADMFIQRHNKALDESWYSRTIDWNMRFGEDATIITVPYNAYIRLVAKLRQRITQRHPAVNDTRANCDPQLGATGDGYDEETPAGNYNSTGAGSGPVEPEESATESSTATSSSTSSVTSNTDGIQNDEPVATFDGATSASGESTATASPSTEEASVPLDQMKIDYNSYSTYDFLDLLANSSVHISATQSVIANSGTKQRSPVAVTGLLYDYATFARRFLNTTSLNIRNLDKENDQSPTQSNNMKIDICPNGDCPTRCGFRNDTIDCLLVDNNGFIIVGEELPYIGRPLSAYDEKLMQSLVDRHVFHQITLIDYQAICTRSAEQFAADQKAAAAASSSTQLAAQISSGTTGSPTPLNIGRITSVLANAASSLVYTLSILYSILFYKSPLEEFGGWFGGQEGEPVHLRDYFVGAQSAFANQSMLAMLPNKTYLRPCEKVVHLYETRPPSEKQSSGDSGQQQQGSPNRKKLSIQSPEYYESMCGCSGWYVYEQVPKTNLIMLIVNTTSACRRCDQTTTPSASGQPGAAGGEQSSNFVPVLPAVLDNFLSTASQGIQATGSNLSNVPIINRTSNEEQVCAMLERDSGLYAVRTPPEACYSYNEKEFQIPLCGGAKSMMIVGKELLLASLVFLVSLRLLA